MFRLPHVTVVGCLVVLFVSSGQAYASCGGSKGTRCAGAKIDQLYVPNDGDRVLVSTDGEEKNLNCQPIEGRFIELRASHPRFNELYTMLLSAKLANHNITLRVRNAETSACSLLYAILE